MLIMTKSAHDGIYQTIKTEIINMVKTYLQANPICDLEILIAYIQINLSTIPGVPAGFSLSASEILRHLKQFSQNQAIDGNNCTAQTIGGNVVMVPNNGGGVVIV